MKSQYPITYYADLLEVVHRAKTITMLKNADVRVKGLHADGLLNNEEKAHLNLCMFVKCEQIRHRNQVRYKKYTTREVKS